MNRKNKKEQKSEKTGLEISPKTSWMIISGLLLLHLILVIHTASRMTVTHDEYWHLPVGHLNLTTGKFDYDNLNPPLLRMWAAIPLLFSQTNPVEITEETDPTGHGDAFLKANPENYHSLIFRGRVMIALLSVGTGFLLGYWAFQWFGTLASILTVALWTFSPNVIAHASLVTTDLGTSFFFIATLFLLFHFLEKPNWKSSVILGIFLGLSQLAKYTSLILYPICFLFFIVRLFKKEEEKPNRKKMIYQGMAFLGISLLVINAGYLFHGSFRPLKSYAFESASMKKLSDQVFFLEIFPVPLPSDYVEGIDHQRRIMEMQHPVYLNSTLSTEGYPEYYLMTLFYKVPHAYQLLFFLGCLMLFLAKKVNHFWYRQIFLLVPFLLLFLIASRSSMQLGIRYLLPVYPFLMLFVGQTGNLFSAEYEDRRWLQLFLLVLIVGVPFSLRHHPYHLSYFNEYAGGAEGGRFHLIDSNMDWGQDLRELKEYLDENPVDHLRLAYFGMLLPAEIGIEYDSPARGYPQPGWHAVSVNYIQGRPHHIRDMEGKSHSLDSDELGYFRYFEPEKIIGTSIYLFHITPQDIQQWNQMLRNAGRIN